MGWTDRGSNTGGDEISRTRPDRPWGLPSLLYNGYWVFPGGKAGRAWCWPPTSISAPRSWKGRAIPLLPLWASVACYRENIYLLPPYLPVTVTQVLRTRQLQPEVCACPYCAFKAQFFLQFRAVSRTMFWMKNIIINNSSVFIFDFNLGWT